MTVSVTDNQGATGTASATMNVRNITPSVGIITASVNPIEVNTSTTASANFTDPGALDTHTAIWNWGDGSTSSANVTEANGSGSVSDSHTYTTAGVYEITLTVTDNNGGVGAQTYQYLSVYGPTRNGVFSAGTKYESPAGAYTQNPLLTGNVKFGFVYKYQGGVPSALNAFSLNFSDANFKFDATTVSALVISNGVGTLTGTNQRSKLTVVSHSGLQPQCCPDPF